MILYNSFILFIIFIEYFLFSFHLDNYVLSIRKTNASHHRCTVRQCKIVENLRLISRSKRLKAMKANKVFIPCGARACNQHYSLQNWNINTQLENRFTRKQLEEMIDSLCEPKNDVFNSPGKL